MKTKLYKQHTDEMDILNISAEMIDERRNQLNGKLEDQQEKGDAPMECFGSAQRTHDDNLFQRQQWRIDRRRGF